MRIFIDSAELADIQRYADDPAISGFTTNATLVKRAGADVKELIAAAGDKEISVEWFTADWKPNVRWKVTDTTFCYWGDRPVDIRDEPQMLWNLTAICAPSQVPASLSPSTIISVFAGRIMDTGRSPSMVIALAKRTGAQVLWASSRSVYDITLAQALRCDIITLTPAIYEKHREWHDMPLEQVAERTIAQFDADR